MTGVHSVETTNFQTQFYHFIDLYTQWIGLKLSSLELSFLGTWGRGGVVGLYHLIASLWLKVTEIEYLLTILNGMDTLNGSHHTFLA